MKTLPASIYLLLLCGCTSTNEVSPASDGPWAAAGLHSQETITRTDYSFAPDGTTHCTWSGAGGERVDANKVIDSAAEYLVVHGYSDSWPRSRMSIDGADPLRIAPFTFHIISIQPTIVVMVAHDFGGNYDKRSVSEILRGATSGQHAASTRYFINVFEYGDSFPDGKAILWYSPDLGIPPTSLDADKEKRMLAIAGTGVSIEAELSGDKWTTRRLK